MDGKTHGIPACRHLLHGYCLSHLTFRCAQIAQLRGFSSVLEAVVRGDVESLDAVVGSPSPCVLGADIEPTATIINIQCGLHSTRQAASEVGMDSGRFRVA